MNEERKDWLLGFTIFLFLSSVLYSISIWINPHNHISWLESFGLFMMIVSIKTGIDTFRENP